MPKDSPETLAAAAAELWRKARCVLVLTGAGISVPSGIPDFRSPGGLWERHRPEEVATLQALRANPARVWHFLLEADKLLGDAQPNPAHLALAELEQAGKVQGIVTQNIDGLHQRAGSHNVIEFHGSARRYYCMGCHRDYAPELVRNLDATNIPWRCDHCNQVIRPDIVFFNERIPQEALDKAFDLAQRADLAMIVGTSGEVAPANSLPSRVKYQGGRVLEINLGQTAYAALADLRLELSAERILPRISALLRGDT